MIKAGLPAPNYSLPTLSLQVSRNLLLLITSHSCVVLAKKKNVLSLHACCALLVVSSSGSFRAKARQVRCSSGWFGKSCAQWVSSEVTNARHDGSLAHSALFFVMNAMQEESSLSHTLVSVRRSALQNDSIGSPRQGEGSLFLTARRSALSCPCSSMQAVYSAG